MVESIRGQRAAAKVPGAPSEVLRTSFQQLSSGTSVVGAQNGELSRQGAVTSPPQGDVKEVAEKLNDAVSYSSLALKRVEQVTEEALRSAPRAPILQEVTRDLDKLRKDINSIVEVLKRKATALEVIGENLTSSDVRLEDVRAAEDHAASIGSKITLNEVEALSAHRGLTFEAVSELLRD